MWDRSIENEHTHRGWRSSRSQELTSFLRVYGQTPNPPVADPTESRTRVNPFPEKTIQEQRDDACHDWSRGKRSIRRVAHRLSEILRDGGTITADDVHALHWTLMDLWGLLEERTVGPLASESRSDDEELALYDSFNLYSDGTAVASLMPISGTDCAALSPDYFEDDIGQHGIPDGWKVVVAEPPHRRRPISTGVGDVDEHVGTHATRSGPRPLGDELSSASEPLEAS